MFERGEQGGSGDEFVDVVKASSFLFSSLRLGVSGGGGRWSSVEEEEEEKSIEYLLLNKLAP